MAINFTICITYFYKRDNIFDLINELNLEKNIDLEVLIRNDNPKEKLILKNHPRIKVINNTNEPLGEIGSLKYLVRNSTGKYICLIADDDLINNKIFKLIRDDKFSKQCYLSYSSTKLETFGKEFKSKNYSYVETLNKYLEHSLHLSGTVGVIYEKNLIHKIFKNLKIDKYLLDTYLLFKILDTSNVVFPHNYGFNNLSTSQISSKIIDNKIFLQDYFNLIREINNTNLLLKFILFILDKYYSLVHREKKKIINNFFNFLILNLKEKRLKLYHKFFIIIYSLKYFLKLFFKAI